MVIAYKIKQHCTNIFYEFEKESLSKIENTYFII